MARYDVVATGGTFDIIHRGHVELLSRAFEVSAKVVIGVTSDGFAAARGKVPENGYDVRLGRLESVISERFPGVSYVTSMLESDFGPAVLERGVQALVVSDETSRQGPRLNSLRAERGLPPVDVITVPMCLAQDGARISTTRIKNAEIDADGRLLPVDK